MIQQRHSVLKKWMIENKIDGLMCQSRPNVFYLTGFDADPHERLVAILLFPEDDPLMVCPGMEVNQVQSIFTKGEIFGYSDTEDPWEKIQHACKNKELSLHKLTIERGIPWERVKKLQAIFPEIQLIEVDDVLLSQRLIKEEEEISYIKEAAKLADYGVEVGIKALKEGITEMEVLAIIEYELKQQGIREMAFTTMVLFGEKAGDPHGSPGDRQLKKGDAVLFDLGVVWKGYCSDITRTVFFDHVKDEDKKVYETVLQAQEKSLQACKPGNKIGNLDVAARKIISDQGYGDYFPHRIGHGLGIEVHEFPSLNETNDSTLKPGMVFTIEPGIYIPNQLGVRIEDDVLITSTGYEILTSFPKELTIITAK